MKHRTLFVLVVLALAFSSAVAADRTVRHATEDSETAIPMPFPRPTNVYVVNWPVVQQIAGTVNVGNLPVDDSGSLRVVTTRAAEPILDLLPSPVVLSSPDAMYWVSDSFSTGEISRVIIGVRGSGYPNAYCRLSWRFDSSESFLRAGAPIQVAFSDPFGSIEVWGPECRVECDLSGTPGAFTLESVKVWLRRQ